MDHIYSDFYFKSRVDLLFNISHLSKKENEKTLARNMINQKAVKKKKKMVEKMFIKLYKDFFLTL